MYLTEMIFQIINNKKQDLQDVKDQNIEKKNIDFNNLFIYKFIKFPYDFIFYYVDYVNHFKINSQFKLMSCVFIPELVDHAFKLIKNNILINNDNLLSLYSIDHLDIYFSNIKIISFMIPVIFSSFFDFLNNDQLYYTLFHYILLSYFRFLLNSFIILDLKYYYGKNNNILKKIKFFSQTNYILFFNFFMIYRIYKYIKIHKNILNNYFENYKENITNKENIHNNKIEKNKNIDKIIDENKDNDTEDNIKKNFNDYKIKKVLNDISKNVDILKQKILNIFCYFFDTFKLINDKISQSYIFIESLFFVKPINNLNDNVFKYYLQNKEKYKNIIYRSKKQFLFNLLTLLINIKILFTLNSIKRLYC